MLATEPIFYFKPIDGETPEDLKLAGVTAEGFYFWDETQTQAYGPYFTEQEALQKLHEYIESDF